MTKKRLGKLVAVIEDPRNSLLSLDVHATVHAFQADYIDFNWEGTTQINLMPDQRSVRVRSDSLLIHESIYDRTQRNWRAYRETEQVWSRLRGLTLYVFERYDIVVAHRSDYQAHVAWFDRIGQYQEFSLHTLTHEIKFLAELKEGYLL